MRERLERKTAVAGVVGLGYVGLPLVRAAHEAGLRVIGFDTDGGKIARLDRGEAYVRQVDGEAAETLSRRLAASDRFEATADPQRLGAADVILLCVPTPLGEHREPDLQYVAGSARMVAGILRPGHLVVLESTTYPGTTRREVLPLLESAGLRCGHDFFLAYSPERVDPGRRDATTATTPRLVGGVDDASADLAVQFYRGFVREVHRVSSAEVAEAAKLLENIYRAVNIAMVNEMKVVLDELGLDVWEVIEAASTKPFGFQPFLPGPGLGGHCLPIDPFYLAWRAREVGRATRFIELAGEVNAQMPAYVVARAARALNEDRKALRGARVLVLGIAYKRDTDDVRESPAAEIIDRLREGGAAVSYHDPHVPVFPPMRRHRIDLASVPLTDETLRDHDCVIIVTDHAAVDYRLLGRSATLIVDTRNAMHGVEGVHARVVKA